MLDSKLDKLSKVFHKVLNKFEYEPDLCKWETTEYWQNSKELKELEADGKLHGDCEDFALSCRDELDAVGVPNRLVFCLVGECGHLVLEVDGWILDCRQTEIIKRDDLDYTWVSISGTKMGDPWHKLLEGK